MGWNDIALWKKFLVYFIVMLAILLTIDILENGGGLWPYHLVIGITLLVALLTYLFSPRVKGDFYKISSSSFWVKGLLLGILLAFLIGLFNLRDHIGYRTIGTYSTFGCKSCTGFPFLGGHCSVNILPNCMMYTIISSLFWVIPAIVLGILVCWIYTKLRK